MASSCVSSGDEKEHVVSPHAIKSPFHATHEHYLKVPATKYEPIQREYREGWIKCALCEIDDTIAIGHGGPGLGDLSPMFLSAEGYMTEQGCVGHGYDARIGHAPFIENAKLCLFGTVVKRVTCIQPEAQYAKISRLPRNTPTRQGFVHLNQTNLREILTYGLPLMDGPYGPAIYVDPTFGDARRKCRRDRELQVVVRVTVFAENIIRVAGASKDVWSQGIDAVDTGRVLAVKDAVRVLIEACIFFVPSVSLSGMQEKTNSTL